MTVKGKEQEGEEEKKRKKGKRNIRAKNEEESIRNINHR